MRTHKDGKDTEVIKHKLKQRRIAANDRKMYDRVKLHAENIR